jgi:hypothetical protein
MDHRCLTQMPGIGILLSSALFVALTLYTFFPLLLCVDTCMVDHVALRGAEMGTLETTDARLNTWILAWVQHALLTNPGMLFDANAFYPVPNALTQSEHLLGVAALMLPLRLFTSNALPVHQMALVLSTLAMALTTFALVRWLTASTFAACAAGASAMLMPWRLSELPHVQLMNAQWFPLVWLYMGRIVYGDARRRNTFALACVMTLQILSSFYLSYFLILSSAALLLTLGLRTPIQRRARRALFLACTVPGISLLLVAIPYLRWNSGYGFHALSTSSDSTLFSDAVSIILPNLSLGLSSGHAVAGSYAIPLVVLALALCAFLPPASTADARTVRRARSFTWALLTMSLACFVMMLGRELQLGDLRVKLPGHWAALGIPGFDKLRNPLRWAIPIGISWPILAGIGISCLQHRFAHRSGRRLQLGMLRGAIALALALGLPALQVPANDGWDGKGARRRGYRGLAALPHGPVIEIPWPLQPLHDSETAGLYMLGSTLHWRPITNGTSGYVPVSYPLLRQVAQDLPAEEALGRVRQLVDVRWIVVHRDALPPNRRAAWADALRSGALRRVYADPATWILEVSDWEQGGRFMQALVEPEPRPTTLAGLARTPLELPERAGELLARVPGPFHFWGGLRIPTRVALRISNRSDQSWPGLDTQTEGLVRLRYAFLEPDGAEVLVETVALAADLPPRSTLNLRVPVTPPLLAGHYRLRMDLVQQLGDSERPLPIDAIELDVGVRQSSGAMAAGEFPSGE